MILPVFCQFHDGGCFGGERYEGHPQHRAVDKRKKREKSIKIP